eukprot:357500-Chlamydomonas_euryale.AAC.8
MLTSEVALSWCATGRRGLQGASGCCGGGARSSWRAADRHGKRRARDPGPPCGCKLNTYKQTCCRYISRTQIGSREHLCQNMFGLPGKCFAQFEKARLSGEKLNLAPHNLCDMAGPPVRGEAEPCSRGPTQGKPCGHDHPEGLPRQCSAEAVSVWQEWLGLFHPPASRPARQGAIPCITRAGQWL